MKAIELIKEFKRYKLGPYIEVPCSLLNPIIERLTRDSECEVINPANEAIAMGMAAGSFLATNRIPLVLIQNSGLCNTLNALTSLNQIYKIPVSYLISWRGQPGIKDAPEHYIMGSKLQKILKTFDIPYEVLSEKDYKTQIRSIINKIRTSGKPGAFILKRGLVKKEKRNTKLKQTNHGISRAEAVDTIIRNTIGRAAYVTTNGYISREALYALSTHKLEKGNASFYMLGSMGHALAISLGIGRCLRKNKKVIVLDGDGGCLMHLGAMASIGKGAQAAKNIIHIVLDNGIYASTGGQPTVSRDINFTKIASGCGYGSVYRVKTISSLKNVLHQALSCKEPSFIHIPINGAQDPKPRISNKYSCEEIKESFMNLLRRP